MQYVKIDGDALKKALKRTKVSIELMSVNGLGRARGYIYDAMRRGSMELSDLNKLAKLYGFKADEVIKKEIQEAPKEETKEAPKEEVKEAPKQEELKDNVLEMLIAMYKFQRESLAVEREINNKLTEVVHRLTAINNNTKTISERGTNE